MSEYHVRYAVTIQNGSGQKTVETIQQDDYQWEAAVSKALHKLAQQGRLPDCDDHRDISITVEKVL